MKRYEIIEHTADVGVRIYGETLEDLFINSASALFALLLDYKPQALKQKNIRMEADSREELFANWLNELISQFFADKFLPGQYNLSINSKSKPYSLEGNIIGQDFNPYENKINLEIKAATYHNLKIAYRNGGYMAEVIFDV